MATVLDFSILGSLGVVFIFIAIFVGGWALLTMINFFKLEDNGKTIYAVLAFALAFIVILSPQVLNIIAFSIPWLTMLMFVGFFFLFFFKMFGDYDYKELGKSGPVFGFVITFVVIIVLFAFANSFGQELLEAQPGVAADVYAASNQVLPENTFVESDQVAPVSQTSSNAGSQRIGDNIILTLFHPKILGMFFMLLLATITVLMIAR